ncbi:E3 ubiquitin-protein ligase TRIM45-like [Saccostrea echinata]|uniref:E3 ubiquitin-protein ligase TRIM45-like n=1 Tax=Saccostrea echinata TaxID=191078 RepID=UPI002A83888F|nr:E3 ubiquitin-protein ligase TRIM45-like [Saccostrea echinata]
MDPRTSAQDVMRCDLCETAVVQMHCDTCLVNLCKACVGEHASADLSEPHKIVDFKNRKSTTLYPRCITHNKERCKIYCKQCDIPLCIKCLVSDQHLGHKLSEMLQVLEEKRDSFFKEQNELNETIYPTYQNIECDIEKRITELEKEYEDLLTTIIQHGEKWHREIDKLVNKFQAELDETKKTQLQALMKHLDGTKQNISKIRNEINSLEVVLNSEDTFQLLCMKSNLKEYRQLPQKIVPCLPRFKPERIQEDYVCKMFGALSSGTLTSDVQGYTMEITQESPEAGSSPPVKQLLNEQKMVIIDSGKRYI